MKLPIRISCRPTIGIDNWEIVLYDRRTNEVFLKADVHTDDIRGFCTKFVSEVAKLMDASVEIL